LLAPRDVAPADYPALNDAHAAALPILACEVNLDPANPGSMAFHVKQGFRPAGEATDPRNGKRVRYLVRDLAAVSPPISAAAAAS